MTLLCYEYEFEGLLTAIFEIYDRRLSNVRIVAAHTTEDDLFAEKVDCPSDWKKAGRVWKKLHKLLGNDGLRQLWHAWLSEKPGIENAIYRTVRYALSENRNILPDITDPDVLEIQQAVKSVGREKHRMEAFVRFQELADNSYYAVVEPDFNVLPLIAPHFTARYADQHWVIYDRKRNYGLHYDLSQTTTFSFEVTGLQHFEPRFDQLSSSEQLFQSLWADYFTSTNIAERKNMKLHLQHLPKRYWKLLTEKTSYRQV